MKICYNFLGFLNLINHLGQLHMQKFNYTLLDYRESRKKQKNRLLLIESCFDLVVQNKIHSVTIEQITNRSNLNFRSFYNYYDNLDILFEDVQVLAMDKFYSVDIVKLKPRMSMSEAFYKAGLDFIEHAFNNKSLIIYLNDFDNRFTAKYPTNRFNKQLETFLVRVFDYSKNERVISTIVNESNRKDFYDKLTTIFPVLYLYLTRLITREKIYESEFSYIKKSKIYKILKALVKI
jgi:hypothetical protein